MDPLSMIVSAIVAGIAAATGDTAGQIVKDAYNGLKGVLTRKLGGNAEIDSLEKSPSSNSRQETLKEELQRTNAVQDQEVLTKVNELIEKLKAVNAPAAAGLTTITNTSTNNSGINIQGSTVSGGVTQSNTTNNATNSSSGAIAQGDNAKAVGAGGVMVDGDVGGSINTGHINTGGGSYVGGDLNTGGAPFVGRDQKVIHNYYGRGPTESAGTQFSETGHKLYAILKDKWFSESDLQDLCFQLDIDWDALSGENKIDKARSLVLDCEKGGKLPKLLSMVRLARPHLRDQLS